jgi:hypothetical protein
VVVVAVLFWARISLLTRLVVYVFTLVVALLWFYFICFDFFFSKLRGRFVVGEHFIVLGLDIPLGVPSNCFCLLCFGGCFSYLFGFNCFVFAYFQKKKTLWVVLANILGYWVIVCLVLWYLLRMACCCLRSLLF